MFQLTDAELSRIAELADQSVSQHIQGLDHEEHNQTVEAMVEAIKEAVSSFVRANR